MNGASAGYLLEHDGFHLLIDCGSAVVSKLPNYIQFHELDACIITHYHADHIADIGVLKHALLAERYMTGKKQTLPIYGHSLDESAFQTLTYKDITKGIAYDPDQKLMVGPFAISFMRTNHPAPCLLSGLRRTGKLCVYR